ncbi:hypothetical protein [Vibrio phage JSF12]|uniref:DUF4326 domain-containing protein n=2 Tax=Jesfedecavirus TaxID=2560156 RepID=A0A2D0Z889_9CAUD|nr:hypothetical protein FDI98_gp009 [Vibrio phage JSF10]YP_009794735.1 hypothetical protein HOS35_gp052 [Vibrio phage JSF12]ASV43378.1 hypothetical protein [Vibrio phage JSF10]ASV43570.1 hypothetical protein [Vibrio phage JSF12]
MSTKIVNVKTEEYDVYIGRGSPLGNPFSSYGRLENIRLYHKQYLPAMIESGRISLDYLKSLKGKRLGCHCKPQPCHGDKLVEIIENA